MQIIKGPSVRPPRLLCHGAAGVGKTTFGCSAPSPVMIPVEDGATQVGVDRFPLVKKSEEAFAALEELRTADHAYQTVVLDSLDWLERLAHAEHAAKMGVQNISEIPYGRGYTAMVPMWERLHRALDALRDERDMAVILIAHSECKHQEPPDMDPYDSYVLKLHRSASAILVEWADVVAFACMEARTKKTDAGFGRESTRGTTTGKRIMRLHPAPAYTAKTRYRLPASLPLDWDAFVDAFVASQEKATVKASIAAIKDAQKDESAAIKDAQKDESAA